MNEQPRNLNYEAVGATRPGEQTWRGKPPGFRRYERTVRIGRGTALWKRVAEEVLDWGVKTRSGFTVQPVTGDSTRVRAEQDYLLTARVGPFSIHEPVRVVTVVENLTGAALPTELCPVTPSPVKKPSSSTAPQTAASG